MVIPDLLSRLPVDTTVTEHDPKLSQKLTQDTESCVDLVVTNLPASDAKFDEIRHCKIVFKYNETVRQHITTTHQRVVLYLSRRRRTGWSDNKRKASEIGIIDYPFWGWHL